MNDAPGILGVIRKALKNDYVPPESTGPGTESARSTGRTIAYIRKLFPFMAAHWRAGVAAAALMLLSTLLSLPRPLITKYVIDDVIASKDMSALAWIVLALVAVLVLESVAGFIRSFYAYSFEQRVIFEIQSMLFRRLLRFPKSFFDTKQTGYLMSRLSGDVLQLRMLLSDMGVTILTNVLKFIGATAILFYLHWKLALLSFIVLPFFISAVHLLSAKTRRISHRTMEASALVSRHIQESLSGIALIKTFAAEEQESNKVSRKLRDAVEINVEQNTIHALSEAVVAIIASTGMVVVLWYGAREIMLDRLTLGGFFAFNAYLGYLYGPLHFLTTIQVYIQPSLAALERVFSLHDLIPEDERDEEKTAVLRLNGTIRFDKVTFEYVRGIPAVRDISFTVTPGEKIAVVGPTGAGKSTLINLILRLYKPTGGSIYFDGIDANELQLRSLRERIGIVSQEIFLFDDTVMNNIRYCRPDAREEEVFRAAKTSYAHEFIEQLPGSYQSTVGERGARLSTGQKQRISIARALLKNPDIIIFDEPTSALDSLTERAIRDVIFDRSNGKTTFVITHRLSSVTFADRIFVLEEGRLSDTGTHEELLQRDGLYRRLCAENQFVG